MASISQASDKESRVIHADEYKRMYDRSAIGIFRYGLDGRYLMANPAGVRLHGYDSETELLRAVRNVSDEVYVHPEDRKTLLRLLEERGSVEGFECEIHRHKTKERIWVRQNLFRVTDEDGRLLYLEGYVEDISERKRAETLLARAIELTPAVFALFDPDDRLIFCNRRYRELYETAAAPIVPGVAFETLVRAFAATTGVGAFVEETEAWVTKRLARRTAPAQAYTYRRKDGEWIEVSDHILEDGSIFTVGLVITDRKNAEEELRASQARLIDAIECIPDGFALYDTNDRLVICNDRYRDVYPRHADILVPGSRFEDMLRIGVERGEFADAIGREEEWIGERVAQHQNPTGPLEQRLSDGRWLRVEEKRTLGGGIVGLRTDITKLKRAEAELQESRERFRDYAEAAADWFWEMDSDLRFTYMSENVERLVGVAPEWHYGKTREELLGDDYDHETWDEHLQTLKDRCPFRDFVYQRVGDDVEPRWLRVNGVPVFADDGSFKGYRGTGSDITEQKQAEERLRASEEQLRQAQKMEAVGKLTGGVAHDFNNLLAVIAGNTELLSDRLGSEDEALQAILRSSGRGAELTARLLAFSRQQSLRPQVIDLGRLVSDMSEMLTRTLGETIEIEIIADPNLWNASADPGQVENALLNLALNARDAMPGGGKLTIECTNARLDEAYVADNPEAKVGDYVVLAVSDEGIGMPTEVRARAFEPFFTTKEVGQGSGLGLSMVYGFAKQSCGHVTICSEGVGGTTVKVYLPRAEGGARREEASQERDLPRGEGEVILVIEDDPDVRALARRVLQSLNYRVIDVPDAAAGLEALAGGQSVNLVLSDVVLPGGTSGPEFSELVRTIYPDLKIIFMSGYPAEAAKCNTFLDPDQVLLNKPFQRQQLAKALREALG